MVINTPRILGNTWVNKRRNSPIPFALARVTYSLFISFKQAERVKRVIDASAK